MGRSLSPQKKAEKSATRGSSFEDVAGERTLSRRQMVGLAGATLASAAGLTALNPKEAKAQGTSYNLVPGYAVRPERYGPDVFENVNGIGWTDQQGLSRGWGTTFRGKPGVRNWFHFPITNPTILDGQRMKCTAGNVLLDLPSGSAFLMSFHLYDQLKRFFARDNLSVSGNYSARAVDNEDLFWFPDHECTGAVGISVQVFFRSRADVTFSGAAFLFHY